MRRGLHRRSPGREKRGGPARAWRAISVELEELKRCLLLEHTRVVLDPEVQTWLRRAADDAASIAWATSYPLLVLPVLLDEKLGEARRKAEVQKSIYLRSQQIVTLAA